MGEVLGVWPGIGEGRAAAAVARGGGARGGAGRGGERRGAAGRGGVARGGAGRGAGLAQPSEGPALERTSSLNRGVVAAHDV
jgi:hypothetical protein